MKKIKKCTNLVFIVILLTTLLYSNYVSKNEHHKLLQKLNDSITSYKKTIVSISDSVTILKNNHRIIIDTNYILNPSIVRFNGQLFDVFIVDLIKDRIEFFYVDDKNQKLCDFESVNNYVKSKGKNFIFITNGGMFQKGSSPLGAFYYKGKEIKAVNLSDGTENFYIKPNGVFCIDKIIKRLLLNLKSLI